MNTDESDPEVSPERLAREQLQKDKANHQASEDLIDWRELEQFIPFRRCYLRRLREKRESLEKRVVEGVPTHHYGILVTEIALIRELERMPEEEKIACFKHLNP
jgi:hypothetical protein